MLNINMLPDRDDKIDSVILELLLHCERLAEDENHYEMALFIHDAHAKCCQIAAARRVKKANA
jgi:hypothetical protein